MDAPLDLYRASREELIALVLRQREQLADLEQRLTRQDAELATQRAAMAHLQERVGALAALLDSAGGGDAAGRPTAMPGLKPTPRTRATPAVPRPRKRRAHGSGRNRVAPTARRVHAYDACPRCGTGLRGGTRTRTREVIELAPARVEVTEHVYVARRCPRCRGCWQPDPELEGVVVGQGRLGVGLLSLIAALREELRLPIRGIQGYLEARHGLRLSVGGIVAALHRVATRAAPVAVGIRAGIRASAVLHVDETGWREAGRNGYAWTFSTATERLFVRGSRERAVLEGVVGDAYAGVLVSDVSAACTASAGRHQYCWAPLLRDVDERVGPHPAAAAVRGWAAAGHALYHRAQTDAAVPEREPRLRRRQRQGYEAEWGILCAPFLGQDTAPQRVLAERITKHLAALFVFVANPEAPATNTAAERSLRPLVTCRKISGGTRSPAGTATKLTLATLFGTWRLHGLNPLHQCRALLTESQL